MPSVIVAFSGGVDSTFVLKVAQDTIGDRVLALTTTSPTMPDQDRQSAIEMAQLIGARHVVIESNELEVEGYAQNPLNRCYLCKSNLFTVCEAKALELGIAEIVDGVNLDDLHDYRPGIKAAEQRRVRHPLVEAEMTKAEIREASRALGLPTWDRPASPCLSSRFPYGTQITLEGLQKVERGETLLHAMGFRVARVRYHGDVARLEVETPNCRACPRTRPARSSIANSKSSASASSPWTQGLPLRAPSTKALFLKLRSRREKNYVVG